MAHVKLLIMDSAAKEQRIRNMLTHKLIGKIASERGVPAMTLAFEQYRMGNGELARQTFQAAQQALASEADALEKGKNGNPRNFDAELLNTAKVWDTRLLSGCAELLQMELKGVNVGGSLMAHADGMMKFGKEIGREGKKADDYFVKKTVALFADALVERGQALHDIAFRGDGRGL